MSETELPLKACRDCHDRPRTHGSRCQWCDLALDERERSAPTQLGIEAIAEHYRFFARRFAHVETAYPDGSAELEQWSDDDPIPVRPDTQATAQMSYLEAFAHLSDLDALSDAMRRAEICSNCETWPATHADRCRLCNEELHVRQRRRANPVTLEGIAARYGICCDLLWQAFEKLAESVERDEHEMTEIEGKQARVADLFSFFWHECVGELLEIRRAHAGLGRMSAEGVEPTQPRWVIMPSAARNAARPTSCQPGWRSRCRTKTRSLKQHRFRRAARWPCRSCACPASRMKQGSKSSCGSARGAVPRLRRSCAGGRSRQGERGGVARPWVLLPQQTIAPSVLMPQVCCEPALTAV